MAKKRTRKTKPVMKKMVKKAGAVGGTLNRLSSLSRGGYEAIYNPKTKKLSLEKKRKK